MKRFEGGSAFTIWLREDKRQSTKGTRGGRPDRILLPMREKDTERHVAENTEDNTKTYKPGTGLLLPLL